MNTRELFGILHLPPPPPSLSMPSVYACGVVRAFTLRHQLNEDGSAAEVDPNDTTRPEGFTPSPAATAAFAALDAAAAAAAAAKTPAPAPEIPTKLPGLGKPLAVPLSKLPLGNRFAQAIVRLGGPEIGAGDLDSSGRGKGGRGKERGGRGRGERGGGAGGRDRGSDRTAGDGRGRGGGRGGDGRGGGKGGRDGGWGGTGRDSRGGGRGGRTGGRGGAWDSAGRRPTSRPAKNYVCKRCGGNVGRGRRSAWPTFLLLRCAARISCL